MASAKGRPEKDKKIDKWTVLKKLKAEPENVGEKPVSKRDMILKELYYRRAVLIQWCFVRAKSLAVTEIQNNKALATIADVSQQNFQQRQQLHTAQLQLMQQQQSFRLYRSLSIQASYFKKCEIELQNAVLHHHHLSRVLAAALRRLPLQHIRLDFPVLLQELERSCEILTLLSDRLQGQAQQVGAVSKAIQGFSAIVQEEMQQLRQFRDVVIELSALQSREASLRLQLIQDQSSPHLP